ncbi:kinase-like domain-containing protein [Leptodontidium sp. 2 PMI_412]|nr:kinase-like domain-containing protein [Leptodontidium sp. 2 PMI_412]
MQPACQQLRGPVTTVAFRIAPTAPLETSTILPPEPAIEEEQIPDYNPHHFYPANPGEVLNKRYKTIVKLGWGSCSTVWLARDVSRTNPLHEGFPYVRTPLDSFETTGLDGSHICLRRCRNGKLSLALLKVYLTFLLRGLDYLHSECHVVHTDLKPDNILVGFEDNLSNPMARKIKDGRVTYRSHNEFGSLKSFGILLKIADFSVAKRIINSRRNIHPIQPNHYRAPEVVLGIGWSYSADIWNLGVLIHLNDGKYNCRKHFAQIIALLGYPPQELLDQEREARRICTSVNDYFGGPFFNSNSEFLYKDLILGDLNLRDSTPSLQGEERQLFLEFVSKMLRWVPEDRKTAKELLGDPWLLRGAPPKS